MHGAVVAVVLAVAILAGVAYYLFSQPTPPDPQRLIIVEASYGESCAGTPAASPGVNHYRQGNVTEFVAQACGAGRTCKLALDVNKMGDPVSGCAKDFKIAYRCGAGGAVRMLHVAAEANGKSAEIDCGPTAKE